MPRQEIVYAGVVVHGVDFSQLVVIGCGGVTVVMTNGTIISTETMSKLAGGA